MFLQNFPKNRLLPLCLFFLLFPLPAMEPEWQLPTGGVVFGNPVASDSGVIYALSEDRHLYAVTDHGRFLWKHYLRNLPLEYISVGPDGSVYVPLSNGEIAAVNPSGREIWRFRAEGRVRFGCAVSSLGFIYFTDENLNLYCLDNRGNRRWDVRLFDSLSAPLTEVPGWGVIAAQKGGRITAYDLRGVVLWHFLAAGDTGQIISDGRFFYACTAAGTLVCLDTDGNRSWSRSIGAKDPSNLIIFKDDLYFLAGTGGPDSRLYRYGNLSEELEYIELETGGSYLAASEEYLIILDGRGTVEKISPDLIPLGSRELDKEYIGVLYHPGGAVITGGSDWRLKGYRSGSAASSGWNQHRGGSTRRGGTVPLFAESSGPPSPDEIFLGQMMTRDGDSGRFFVLDELEKGLSGGKYSGCEDYILEFLETLAGEGVLNPLYQEGAVLNDFPMVRIKAAGLLAEYGTFRSQKVLLSVFRYEWEPAAASAQMDALGRLGSDLKGSITRTLYEKLPRTGSPRERQIYAESALSCLKMLTKYLGDIPDPSALEMIMTIYRGNYGRKARKAALDFLGS